MKFLNDLFDFNHDGYLNNLEESAQILTFLDVCENNSKEEENDFNILNENNNDYDSDDINF